MKLENDEYYLDIDGNIIKNDFANQLLKIFEGNTKTVAHIPKELHKHILNEINSYYTDKDFKEVVDSVWGK